MFSQLILCSALLPLFFALHLPLNDPTLVLGPNSSLSLPPSPKSTNLTVLPWPQLPFHLQEYIDPVILTYGGIADPDDRGANIDAMGKLLTAMQNSGTPRKQFILEDIKRGEIEFVFRREKPPSRRRPSGTITVEEASAAVISLYNFYLKFGFRNIDLMEIRLNAMVAIYLSVFIT